MNVLVIGSGGREHALVWKLRESPQVEDIFCAPGNAGIAQEGECFSVDVSHPKELLALALDLKAHLTVVGPEAPLVAGVADEFEQAGLALVGPNQAAARLEGSKIFAKRFMERCGIPTARFTVAEDFETGIQALRSLELPVVIKADGLAAGKGVVVAQRLDEAEKVLDDFMRQHTLGSAGERVVIEECLSGEEVSFIVLTDGKGVLPFVPTQDHKRAFDNDEGPNTGGMGAYSHDRILEQSSRDGILRLIVKPTLDGLAAEGVAYRGFLYFGLMLTSDGPKVLEFNVRLGDPETQPMMMRLRSDLVDLLLAAQAGQLSAIEARWTPNPAVCVVLASNGYPGQFETGKVITGYDAAEAIGGVKLFHAGTKFVDHQLLTNGGRVMGVTAVGQDLERAVQRAYTAVGKVEFEGMHFRRDIGARALRRAAPVPKEKDSLRQSNGVRLEQNPK